MPRGEQPLNLARGRALPERVEYFELCFERMASIVTYAQRAIEVFKGLVPNADKITDLTVENLLYHWGFEYKNNRWWWVYKN